MLIYCIIILLTYVPFVYTSDKVNHLIEDLYRALNNYNYSAVERILTDYPLLNVSRPVRGKTLLNTAVAHSNARVVCMLTNHAVRNGMDEITYINQADAHGNTPLHIACRTGQYVLARALLQKGAAADACNEEGKVPLHLAAERPYSKLCNVVAQYTNNIDTQDGAGITPLLYAIMNSYSKNVTILLEHEASVTACDHEGNSPLHHAAENMKSVQLLLGHEANPNATNKLQLTPLHVAASYGNKAVVQELIPVANINAQDKNGTTPLLFSILFNYKDIALNLLHHNADPNIAPYKGHTPLHTAIRFLPAIVPDMIEYGAYLSLTQYHGVTRPKKSSKIITHI